jgi:murein DD-endopeptidase MepM/ murein hydrolase activator NlpD
MINCFGVSHGGRFCLKSAAAVSTVIAGLAIGGCSADVTRFDSASFNLNDPPDSRPIPSQSIRTSSLSDGAAVGSPPRGPYGAGASSVQVAALPDAGPSYQPAPSYSPPAYNPPPAYTPPARSYDAKPFGRARSEAAPSERGAAPSTMASGEEIVVQPGDTLYSLSRAHHVSLAELMSANSLSNPNVHPGQKLHLPSAGGMRATRSSVAAAKAVESARPAPAPLAEPPHDVAANYNATYTVKPGESLYGIARSHNVKFAELQQVNGITDPRRVKPGVVLKVPAGASTAASASAPASQPVSAAPASVADNAPAAVVPPLAATEKGSDIPSYGQSLSTRPTIINSERRVAALDTGKASDASPAAPPAPSVASSERPASAPPVADVAPAKVEPPKPEEKVALAAPAAASAVADSVKLRWPTTGRVIAGFGGRPDGTHNDGINLAVPLGTEVHAAESGVVAYSGNELKGYGNLVLLRHDNGWVTAYAHNDELLVKRGDKVKRGQVISKAGKTGSVDQPQVHFELRQGSRPVDPTPYLEKL